MKKMALAAFAAILLPLLHTPQAKASSLPKADMRKTFAIGSSPSIGGDTRIGYRTSLGGSLGLPFIQNGFNFNGTPLRYDLRLMYNFINSGGFTLNGLAGAFGDLRVDNLQRSQWFGVELGVAMAYRFSPEVTARVNIVPGFNFFNRGNTQFLGYTGPSSGAELGLKITPTLEATLGWNGQGDLLGLRFLI